MSVVLNSVNEFVTLSQINCGKCGATYAINERFRAECQEKGTCWTCPYCQASWGYTGSEVDRLKKQLEAKERELGFARNNAAAERSAREKTERRLSATKSAKTRMANRIKHGVCPCCNRTFQNLMAHMATQHPQFNKGADAA
jgi:phage/plasmid primase-like uncharacterized protein